MSEIWSSQTEAEEYYPIITKFKLTSEPGPFLLHSSLGFYDKIPDMAVVFDQLTLADEYQDNRQRTDSEEIEPRSQSSG